MKFLQKLGKSLMLPVACLPICGILMGIGYALCPSTMQGGEVTGIIQQIGYYLVKAGGALIDNMAILFAIGIGVGMSDENDGTGGLASLASWLMITNLLATANVTVIMPSIAENKASRLAVILQRQAFCCYRSGRGFYHCICSAALCMADPLRWTGCTGRRYCKTRRGRSRPVCILQQTAHPVWSAPCT